MVNPLFSLPTFSSKYYWTSDYVQASMDLATEYVKLGKTQRAANIYAHVYNVAKNAYVREETRVLYYLRYAELFATMGNVLKGYVCHISSGLLAYNDILSSSIYCEATSLADRLLNSDEKGLSSAEKVKARVSALERAAVASSTFAVIQYSKVSVIHLFLNGRINDHYVNRTIQILR